MYEVSDDKIEFYKYIKSVFDYKWENTFLLEKKTYMNNKRDQLEVYKCRSLSSAVWYVPPSSGGASAGPPPLRPHRRPAMAVSPAREGES